MTESQLVLAGLAMATFALTARDRALGAHAVERILFASAWLISATVMALAGNPTSWVGVAILASACVGTRGRPALIMNRVIEPARITEADRRRGLTGQLLVIATIVVAAILTA